MREIGEMLQFYESTVVIDLAANRWERWQYHIHIFWFTQAIRNIDELLKLHVQWWKQLMSTMLSMFTSKIQLNCVYFLYLTWTTVFWIIIITIPIAMKMLAVCDLHGPLRPYSSLLRFCTARQESGDLADLNRLHFKIRGQVRAFHHDALIGNRN